jgi:hypothetical protein
MSGDQQKFLFSRLKHFILGGIVVFFFASLLISVPGYYKTALVSYFDSHGCDTTLAYYCESEDKCKFFTQSCEDSDTDSNTTTSGTEITCPDDEKVCYDDYGAYCSYNGKCDYDEYDNYGCKIESEYFCEYYEKCISKEENCVKPDTTDDDDGSDSDDNKDDGTTTTSDSDDDNKDDDGNTTTTTETKDDDTDTTQYDKYGCNLKTQFYCTYTQKCLVIGATCERTIINTTTTNTTTTTSTTDADKETTTTTTPRTITCPDGEIKCLDKNGNYYCSYKGSCMPTTTNTTTTTTTTTNPTKPETYTEKTCDAWDPFCNNGHKIDYWTTNFTTDDTEYEKRTIDRLEVQRSIWRIEKDLSYVFEEIEHFDRKIKQLDWSISSALIQNAYNMLDKAKEIATEVELFTLRDIDTIKTFAEVEAAGDKLKYIREMVQELKELEPKFVVFDDLVFLNTDIQRTLANLSSAREKVSKTSTACDSLFQKATYSLNEILKSPFDFIDYNHLGNGDLLGKVEEIRVALVHPAFECKDRIVRQNGINGDEILNGTIAKLNGTMQNTEIRERIEKIVSKTIPTSLDVFFESMGRNIHEIDESVSEKVVILVSNATEAGTKIQNKVINRTNDVLMSYQELGTLKVLISRTAQKKLEDIHNLLLENHWCEETVFNAQKELKKLELLIRQDGSEEEILVKLKGILAYLKEEKHTEQERLYDDDEIPWKDVKMTDWFAPFAFQAKNNGIMKGDGSTGYTDLKPSRKTLRAEAYAMVARAAGIENGDQLVRSLVGLPDWAYAGTATLQKKGVSVVLYPLGNADGEITRREVAKLLKETFGLQAKNTNAAQALGDYSLMQEDPSLIDAVSALYETEIMTGYGSGSPMEGQFGINEPLLRAELAKIIIKIKELNE